MLIFRGVRSIHFSPPFCAEAVHLFNPSTCSYIICDSAPALGYPIRHASQGFQDLLLGQRFHQYFGGENGSSNCYYISGTVYGIYIYGIYGATYIVS